ncbi:MAG: hypothetical protein MJ176_00670 [Treponema sp.]|nr:hypothetical protein [Treponema sp.]
MYQSEKEVLYQLNNQKSISRTSRTLMAAFTDTLFQIVAVLFPFILRTIFITRLGSEYLGLNGLCTSILGTLNIVDFGVDAALKYRLFKPVSEKDWKTTGVYLNYIRKVYFFIGLVILLAAIVVMPFLQNLIKSDIPSGINIYVIFACYLLQTVLSYWFFNYYQLLFYANQQKNVVDLSRMASFIVTYLLQFIAVYKRHFYLFAFMQVLFPLVFGILLRCNARRKYCEIILTGNLEEEEKKSIWKDTFAVGLFKIRTISRNTLDNTIISAFLGLVILANYNNYSIIAVVPYMMCMIITSALAPSIGNYQVTESKQSIYHIFTLTYLLQLFVIGFASVCYYELIQNFILIWLGIDFILADSFVLIFTVQIFFVCVSNYFSMLRETLNLWQRGKWMAVLEILLNLVLNILLTKLIGLSGIVLATVLTVAFINMPTDFYVIIKKYFGETPIWALISIILIILGCVGSVFIINAIMTSIPIIKYWTYLIKIFITFTVTVTVLFLALLPLKTFRELIGIVVGFIKKHDKIFF